VETIPCNRFKQHLVGEKVVTLTIGPEDISGTLKGKEKEPGRDFTTIRVNDPDLVKDLDAHKVSSSGHYESKFLSAVLSHPGLCGGRPAGRPEKQRDGRIGGSRRSH
jgi:cell division protease FtsH